MQKIKMFFKCIIPMSIASILLITISTIGVTKVAWDLSFNYQGPFPVTVESYTKQVMDIILSGEMIILMMGTWSILCILIHGLWYKKKYAIPSPLPDFKSLLPDLLTTLFMFFAIVFLIEFFNAYLPSLTKNYVEMMDIKTSAGLIIYTVFMAPISEEFVFRGLTQSIAKEKIGVREAIFFQSFLFGLMHMNLIQSLYAFGMGVYLGYMKEKYKNILVPIFMHAIFNSINYIPLNLTLGLIGSLTLIYVIVSKETKTKDKPINSYAQLSLC